MSDKTYVTASNAWTERALKAEAERDEARMDYDRVVEKFDNVRASLAQIADLLGIPIDRPDGEEGAWHDWLISTVPNAVKEALAQVAVLVAAIKDTKEAQIQHRLTGTWVMDRLEKTLSNLPAAAKEMVDERAETKRLLEVAQNNVENLSRLLYPKASMRLVDIADDDALQAENARLREAIKMSIDLPMMCHSCEEEIASVDAWVTHICAQEAGFTGVRCCGYPIALGIGGGKQNHYPGCKTALSPEKP